DGCAYSSRNLQRESSAPPPANGFYYLHGLSVLWSAVATKRKLATGMKPDFAASCLRMSPFGTKVKDSRRLATAALDPRADMRHFESLAGPRLGACISLAQRDPSHWG